MRPAEPDPTGQRGDAERGIGRATGNFAGMVARIGLMGGGRSGAFDERVERRFVFGYPTVVWGVFIAYIRHSLSLSSGEGIGVWRSHKGGFRAALFAW
jgi:hypothetical protein